MLSTSQQISLDNTYVYTYIYTYIHTYIDYIHMLCLSLDAFDLKVDLSDIGLESEKDAAGKEIITFEK